jgi:tRNA-dihydrouridine synthase
VILAGAFDLGISAATLHGRTVSQGYVGPSRWAFLREAKTEFPERTLLGSGDLFTAGDCVRMLEETGVDGVSIARGAIGNPWIFASAAALLRGEAHPAPPRLPEQREVLREHLGLARGLYGDEDAPRRMRKHLVRYARLHPDREVVRNAMARAGSVRDVEDLLGRFYAEDREGVWGEDAVDTVARGA